MSIYIETADISRLTGPGKGDGDVNKELETY